MKFRYAPLAAAVLTAALVPAVAGNEDPEDRVTDWTQPTVHSVVDGQCIWKKRFMPNVIRDDQTSDPENSPIGTCDAYAHALAEGMQVFGYAWAYDNVPGIDADVSISAGSAGFVQVYAEVIPPGCVPMMQAFWMPRMRLRVDQSNAAGGCVAGGVMKGDIPALAVHTLLSAELTSKSDEEISSASLTVGVPLVLTLGVSVPLFTSSEGGSLEQTLTDVQHGARSITSATATYSGTSWVGAYANGNAWYGAAESEAWVWDSKPGLELEGYCVTPCTGQIVVQYGW